MSFELPIPISSGEWLTVPLAVGQCIFVLGANGTGKSSLMHRFFCTIPREQIRRITAHRQTWFTSNAISVTGEQRRSTEVHVQNADSNPTSRWKDDYAGHRANVAIYDLIDAENVRARSIARAVDINDFELARNLSANDAPLKTINELLRLSNIPIEISVREGEQVLASKDGSPPYSVAELSDGERNALLIASNVLTVPSGTLLLIDEPERHLHRSIIATFFSLLFSKRPDCAFVVSTHDTMLPLDNPSSRTLLVRACSYNEPSGCTWDVDLISQESEIDENLKRDILGARRNLIFVEGTEESLDKPLYSLVFPHASVVAKASCRDVEQAVTGIRSASSLHRLCAFGIVDNDNRPPEDVLRLAAAGIFATPGHSVESLYYHPEIQRRVLIRIVEATGENFEARLVEAKSSALSSIRPHVKRMSERAVEKTIRNNIESKRPTQEDISAGVSINITIDVSSIVAAESLILAQAINDKNLHFIICRYPIRETPLLNEVAKKLGFQNRAQYESAVRKLLMDDASALEFVRRMFDSLWSEMSSD